MSRPLNHGEAWVEDISGRADTPSCCLAYPGGLCCRNYKWSVVGGQKSSKIDDGC